MSKRSFDRQVGASVHTNQEHGADIDYEQVHKCTTCGLTAAKGELGVGTKLEIKCRKCGVHFALIGL